MKLKIEDIKKTAAEQGWKVLSEKYINLDTEMNFVCDEGHNVYLPYKSVRGKWECPVCKENKYHDFSNVIIPKGKKVKRTLALDQATHKTGFSIYDNGELIKAGVFEAFGNTDIARSIEIKNWLLQMIQKWNPDMIGIEGIQYQENKNNKLIGITTYQMLARLQGILMGLCYEKKIDCEVVPVGTWRAHCGVKGKNREARKKYMQSLVKDGYDITVTDDMADAIGIGKYVSEALNTKVDAVSWI